MTRSPTDTDSDLRYGRRAAHQYRLEARRLRRQAAEQAAANQPLTARITRYRALMAEHAAEAETANPETPGFVA